MFIRTSAFVPVHVNVVCALGQVWQPFQTWEPFHTSSIHLIFLLCHRTCPIDFNFFQILLLTFRDIFPTRCVSAKHQGTPFGKQAIWRELSFTPGSRLRYQLGVDKSNASALNDLYRNDKKIWMIVLCQCWLRILQTAQLSENKYIDGNPLIFTL